MKKFLIATMLGVTMITSAFASDANEISNKARYNFKNTYKNVEEVSWSVKSGLNAASFVENGVVTEVFYDYDGTKVATCKSIDYNELAESVRSTILQKYGDCSVKEVISYNDDLQTYQFVSLENENEKLILKISGKNLSIFKKEKK